MAKCSACEKQLPEQFVVGRNETKFCNQKCLEDYYLKKIAKQEENLSAWRKVWQEAREAYGSLACKVIIPPRYQDNYGKFCTGKK